MADRGVSKPGMFHTVVLNGSRSCDCYDFVHGKAPLNWCKHFFATSTAVKARELKAERKVRR